MRKIKLILSDLHVSKGKTLEDGSPNLLEDFFYDRELMDLLAWFSTGEYRKYDVELIFNGDFLNTLQVDLWEDSPEIITEDLAVEKVKAIIRGHHELFDALKEFVNMPHHSLTIITGNHDPAFLWPAVRDFFGAFMNAEVRFPLLSCRFDGFHIEHGNQHTAINAYDENKLFIQDGKNEPRLNIPWGSSLVIRFLNKVKRQKSFADKVRPLSRYLIFTLIADPLFGWPAVIRLFLFFITTRFRPGLLNLNELRRTWQILIEGFKIMPNLERAARKMLFAEPDIHTVIMGHSHVCLRRRFRVDKEYINTGTWNDMIYLDIEHLGRHRKLTFAIIEYPESGRPRAGLFEWKGLVRPFEPVEQ